MIHGQWWSIFKTHYPHNEQWCALTGFHLLHRLHDPEFLYNGSIGLLSGGGGGLSTQSFFIIIA